jgi:hypothetical protein
VDEINILNIILNSKAPLEKQNKAFYSIEDIKREMKNINKY